MCNSKIFRQSYANKTKMEKNNACNIFNPLVSSVPTWIQLQSILMSEFVNPVFVILLTTSARVPGRQELHIVNSTQSGNERLNGKLRIIKK